MSELYDDNGEPKTPPKLSIEDWGKNDKIIKHPQADDMTLKIDQEFRALQFRDFKKIINEFGILEALWGYDIFYGKIPFLKLLLLINILIWILLIK